jgi:hypothetical protein
MFPVRKIFGQGGVKFVVVAAGARRAVVFVCDVSLDQLQVGAFWIGWLRRCFTSWRRRGSVSTASTRR